MKSVRPRGRYRLFVASVGVPGNPGSRIIGEYALETHTHLRRAVGNDHLTGVKRIADAHSATMVKRDPRRAARDIQHRVEDGPVSDSISPVAHAFGFPERRGHAAGVEMIATDRDRC